jgi:hypothetical protein
MNYPLASDKTRATCVSCGSVFIVDLYARAGFCNYDKSSLIKENGEY